MKSLMRVLVIVSLLTPALARGQDADLLKPLVDDQTIVIARVDFSRLDIPVLRAWLLESVRNGGGDVRTAEGVMDEIVLNLQQWIKTFTTAGGSRIYFLCDTTFMETIIAVPLEKDANTAALKEVLPNNGGFERAQRDNLLVWARPARLKQVGQAVARPEVAAAMASIGDSAVALVLVLSTDARKVVEQTVPALPPELGGKPTALLLSGLSYAVCTLDTRPQVAMRAFVQMDDAESARNAAAVLTAMIDAARKNPDLARQVPTVPALLELLRPVAAGNRVETPLEGAAPKVATVLVEAAIRARDSARMTVAMSNARQILVACRMYAADHKDEFPTKLDQIEAFFKEPKVFTLPHRPGAAWVYLPPPPLNKIAAATHIVLHEPAEPWPPAGVIVAFADAHVEVMKDQKRFQDTLKKTLAVNSAK